MNTHPHIAKDGRYHFFYITRLSEINGFYVGIHSTTNLDDGYVGSGRVIQALKQEYKRRGLNFRDYMKTTPVLFFESREQLLAYEKAYVDEDLLSHVFIHNLALGGIGGKAVTRASKSPPWYFHKTKKNNNQLKMWSLLPELYELWDGKTSSAMEHAIFNKYGFKCSCIGLVKLFNDNQKLSKTFEHFQNHPPAYDEAKVIYESGSTIFKPRAKSLERAKARAEKARLKAEKVKKLHEKLAEQARKDIEEFEMLKRARYGY